MKDSSFSIIEDLAKNYFNTRKRLYIVDGYAGYDKEDRVKIRVVCTRAYHALFMTNMLIMPNKQELEEDFASGADYYVFNAGIKIYDHF